MAFSNDDDTNTVDADNGSAFEDVDMENTSYTYLWRRSCFSNIYDKFKMDVPRDGIEAEFYNWALTEDNCNMTM